MDIDVAQLAAQTAAILAPFLPYLLKGGKAAAKAAFERVGQKFVDETWEQAEKLWKKIWPKAKKKEAAQEAVEDMLKEPDDKGALASWEYQLKKMLSENPNLAAQVEITVEQINNNISSEINIGRDVNNAVIMAGMGNQLDIHGNVYVGAQPQSDEEALEIYRSYMAQTTSGVSTSGLNLKADATSDQKEQMRLANVYIELDTKTQIEAQGKMREKNEFAALRGGGEDKIKPLSVLQAVAQNQMLALKGDPGSGKSTFVNFLSFCLASKNTKLLDKTWRKQELLPVIVILRDFAKAIPENPKPAETKHLCDFIAETLENKKLSFASAPILKLLEQGKVLVFLDGLDEVQSVEKRIFARDAVKEFVTRYGKNRFVATCRVLSYQPPKEKDEPDLRLKGFPEFEVAPFTPEKIDLFIEHWYAELTSLNAMTKSEADESIKNLKTAAQTRQELQKLAPNPLLLTVMAIVNTYRGKLPDARAHLYKDAIEILLWQWEKKNKKQEARLRQLLNEAGRNELDLEKVIWKLAYEAHAQTTEADIKSNALAGIGELTLEKALAKINKGDRNWAAQIIESMRLRAGLLLERDTGVFTFPHRSFQEFLAGTYIDSEDDDNFVSKANELANNLMVWREAILWAVSRCVNVRGNINNPIMLAASLCPSSAPKDQNDWLRIWFAGEVLLEAGVNRVEENDLGKDTLLPRVRNRLVQLLEQNALTPQERASAGDTLARLSDPRFDAEHWQLPQESLLGFVHIPAGEFTMGTKKKDIEGLVEKYKGDKEWFEREGEQHTVRLPNYFIAKYPVTVAQFKVFAEESGYKKMNETSLQGIPNHPVRYVTWFDAVAYCKWLNEKLKSAAPHQKGRNESEQNFWNGIQDGKLIVSLPSEAEWEKAARHSPLPQGEGSGVREFPWEGDFEQNNANCNMVIGNTSAVGCFPQGRSPYGLLDMSGNVWEWTRSIYEKYPYQPGQKRETLDDEKSARVLRGGAFPGLSARAGNGSDRGVRCAYRYGDYPGGGWNYNGFRVVVASPPISLVTRSGS